MGQFSRWIVTPSFQFHIQHIVFVRSEKQMIGPHTSGIVAAMQNEHPVRNFSIVQNPHGAVSAIPFVLHVKQPVTVAALCAFPNPTIACLVNQFPKSALIGSLKPLRIESSFARPEIFPQAWLAFTFQSVWPSSIWAKLRSISFLVTYIASLGFHLQKENCPNSRCLLRTTAWGSEHALIA